MEDREPDLIQDLGQRLGVVWKYDRLISANTGHPEMQALWRSAKSQELERIEQLKDRIMVSSRESDDA